MAGCEVEMCGEARDLPNAPLRDPEPHAAHNRIQGDIASSIAMIAVAFECMQAVVVELSSRGREGGLRSLKIDDDTRSCTK